jgi:hypothetical protein
MFSGAKGVGIPRDPKIQFTNTFKFKGDEE